MAKVVVNFKTEEEVKKQFDQVCDELGITMTAAINIFMKQVIIQGRIPFEVTSKKKAPVDIPYQDGEKECLIEPKEYSRERIALLEYFKKVLEQEIKDSEL